MNEPQVDGKQVNRELVRLKQNIECLDNRMRRVEGQISPVLTEAPPPGLAKDETKEVLVPIACEIACLSDSIEAMIRHQEALSERVELS